MLSHGQIYKIWMDVRRENKYWKILGEELRHFQATNYPKSIKYIAKTTRPRKVHFVWADTNNVKCEVHENKNTIYSNWAPDITCTICRQMMFNRGITQII